MLSFPGGYTFNGFVASATPGAEALQVESLWSSFGRKKVVGFFGRKRWLPLFVF